MPYVPSLKSTGESPEQFDCGFFSLDPSAPAERKSHILQNTASVVNMWEVEEEPEKQCGHSIPW